LAKGIRSYSWRADVVIGVRDGVMERTGRNVALRPVRRGLATSG